MSVAQVAAIRPRIPRRFDPAWAIWRLLTSVRFAVVLIAGSAMACALGVLIPQAPAAVRADPGRLAGWLDLQHGKFGPLTTTFYRLGLFDIFGTFWFRGSLAVLSLAVAVCAYNRFPATWRTIRRPQKRVSESYLRKTRNRAEFAAPADATALERVFRRHRYRVERFEEDGAVHLFADRYQWAQLGTFASHIALIIFIAGGLVTLLTGYETHLTIAEGRGAPVFPVEHSGQMQVYVDQAVGRFGDDGRPLDYRSFLTVYKDGREAKKCVTTVNDPCQFDGYRLSQSAFFGYGAELVIKDVAAGRTIYDEILPLGKLTAAPQLTVTDAAGATLFAGTVSLEASPDGVLLGTLPIVQTGRTIAIGLRRDGRAAPWTLVVADRDAMTSGNTANVRPALLQVGQSARVGDATVRFMGIGSVPAALLSDIPVPPAAASKPDGSRPLLLEMSNAVFGSAEASSGQAVSLSNSAEPPTLTITGFEGGALSLKQGESATVGGYEYSFAGQRPFAGIQVKRDRGATFIWVALGLLVFGMVVTFQVPRRRAWVKVSDGRVYAGGLAGAMVDLGAELRRMGAEAGSPDAAALEDEAPP